MSEQVAMTEVYRDRMYKQEEENDENMGLATQELAKVKHMVRQKTSIIIVYSYYSS